MFARVLFTDGASTFTVYWIQHTGTDVYHGWHPNEKGSYHASGQVHFKTRDGEMSGVEMCTPLGQLRGVHVLGSLGLINHPGNFKSRLSIDRQYNPQRRKSKSDAILVIDSRAIPLDANIQLTIGLLEPGNLTAMANRVYQDSDGGVVMSLTKQFLLDTSVKPWVWVKVDMATQADITERLARFKALATGYEKE